VNADVYRLYLQGKYDLNLGNQNSILRAVAKFEQAIHVDPSYAPAYAALAYAHGRLGYTGFAAIPASRDTLKKAKALAVKALELDDSLVEAHTSLAFIKWALDLDIAGAEREYLRALSLSPGSAVVRLDYAPLLSAMGRHTEAITMAREAKLLDPLPLKAALPVATAMYFARQYDEAIEEILEARSVYSDQKIGRFTLGLSLAQKGRYAEGIEELEQHVQDTGGDHVVEAYLGYAYALAGRQEAAEAILDKFNRLYRKGDAPYAALIYAGLGRNDEAFEVLEKSYEERWGHLTFLKLSPAIDGLRSDPRYVDLIRKIGLGD
jgi:tetratricopeptide (TPR) repeat protein